MKKALLIALFISLFTEAYSQDKKIEMLISGLKSASSFIIANNSIYIVETESNRVSRFSMDGEPMEKYGSLGNGDYQFDSPYGITTSNGLKIYVSDPGNNRVQVFDRRWQYLGSIKTERSFRNAKEIEPSFLTVNRVGEVIFYDEGSNELGWYNEDGASLDRIPLSSDIKDVSDLQASSDGIYILDKKTDVIHRLSGNGFYESFYDAEKGDAFFTVGESFYMVNSSEFYVSDRDGKEFSIPMNLKEAVVSDLIVIENEVYILTESNLYKFIVDDH